MKARRMLPDMRTNKSCESAARGIFWSQSGQNLVELALLTPLLLALLMGVMELGRFAYMGILIGNAARAGAAYGAQGLAQAGDSNGIQTAADNDFLGNGQDSNLPTISGGWGGSYNSCGCDNGSGSVTAAPANCTTQDPRTFCVSPAHWVVLVSVEAKGTFNPMFSYPGISHTITIDRTCTMRAAQQ